MTAGAPGEQTVLHEVRPVRVALQRGRVADDDQRHPRTRQPDIDAPLVLDEADGAALAGPHRREDRDIFLATLHAARFDMMPTESIRWQLTM